MNTADTHRANIALLLSDVEALPAPDSDEYWTRFSKAERASLARAAGVARRRAAQGLAPLTPEEMVRGDNTVR